MWGTALLLLVALIICWRPLLDMLKLAGDQEAVSEYLQTSGPAAPILLFVILFIQVFLALIPGHAFIVAGGYVFGFWQATVLTTISTTMATQLAFLFTRRHGLPFVKRIASENFIHYWNRIAGNRGKVFFFFAFILPIFPSDFMCYIAGLGRIQTRDFFFANFSGRFFVAAVLCSLGSHGFNKPIEYALVMVLLYGLIFLTWKPITKHFTQQSVQNDGD